MSLVHYNPAQNRITRYRVTEETPIVEGSVLVDFTDPGPPHCEEFQKAEDELVYDDASETLERVWAVVDQSPTEQAQTQRMKDLREGRVSAPVSARPKRPRTIKT